MVSKDKKVGVVTHFYGNLLVGIVKLSAPVKVGDTLRVSGKQTNFSQVVSSMQLEHQPIQSAKKGNEVGIKVDQAVREQDEVFLVG